MNLELMELLELTNEQIKAFKKLKRAFNDCKKKGLSFANLYGHFTAYDSSKIKSIGDDSVGYDGLEYMSESQYVIRIPHEWSDDNMFLYPR